ncbi:MAG: hypothetical protein NT133_09710 [Alphaproteobacteria bacterium]|nr:hypothetical protein [Alphaproteobacteria bacterium]
MTARAAVLGGLRMAWVVRATIVMLTALLLMRSIDAVRAELPAAKPAEAKPADPRTAEAKPAIDAKPVAKPPAPPPTEPTITTQERSLLLDLRKRREELDAREQGIALQQNLLAATEKRIGERAEELAALQRRLETLERAARERDEANVRGLVKIYETMKPREAAAILNEIDLAVAMPIFRHMKEGKAALIIAALQPDRARDVTSRLAPDAPSTGAAAIAAPGQNAPPGQTAPPKRKGQT